MTTLCGETVAELKCLDLFDRWRDLRERLIRLHEISSDLAMIDACAKVFCVLSEDLERACPPTALGRLMLAAALTSAAEIELGAPTGSGWTENALANFDQAMLTTA